MADNYNELIERIQINAIKIVGKNSYRNWIAVCEFIYCLFLFLYKGAVYSMEIPRPVNHLILLVSIRTSGQNSTVIINSFILHNNSLTWNKSFQKKTLAFHWITTPNYLDYNLYVKRLREKK